jgi:hypothetical protein
MILPWTLISELFPIEVRMMTTTWYAFILMVL